MSAYWKIPLQALILLIGVLVFVFYLFERPPLLFNPSHENEVRTEARAEYDALSSQYVSAWTVRQQAATAVAGGATGESVAVLRAAEAATIVVRDSALALAQRVTGQTPRDVNYIMPHFVLNYLPLGLAGLFIAAVLAAAMSSIAAELNSLSTATVIDFYRRWVKPEATDAHYLRVSKAATFFWGIVACIVAFYAVSLGSLIEVVNRFGSFFYGSILGVFLLAMIPAARGWGGFIGLIAGMLSVGFVSFAVDGIAFLWLNVVGAVVVVVVGLLASTLSPRRTQHTV
jgi:Na+/proline symporter